MQDLSFLNVLTKGLEKLKSVQTSSELSEMDKVLEMGKISDEISSCVCRYEKEYVDFRRICDHLSVTLFVTDTNGKVVYINPAYLKKTGLQEHQLIGRTMGELQKDDIIQCDVIPAVLREGKPKNAIGYVIPTDYRGFIAAVPVKDDEGRIQYVMTTDWDVNTIMEMENRLRQLKKGEVSASDESLGDETGADKEVLYVSDQMRLLMSLTKTIAQTDVTVLITGETGTGKELLSSEIVRYSKRAGKPFVKVNCAAIPQELMESELFGYDEGAFTGAKRGGKKGAFEQANGGTILLDEIGELPFQVQAKLLRALQESEITRVGGHEAIKLDFRVIAATNRNLLREIKEGRFREDLYYRLNIMPLEIPALRERVEDISFLVGRFLEEFDKKYQKTTLVDSDVIDMFRRYDWPGNVRELRNLTERLVILCTSGRITGNDVRGLFKGRTRDMIIERPTLKQAVARVEMTMIKEAIQEYGSKNKAAEVLGVDHSTLVRKCQRYEID